MKTFFLLVATFAMMVAIVGLESRALAATIKPGQSFFGYLTRTEYIQGNLPIIIVVPHGGSLAPPALPDRNASCLREAVGTIEMTRWMITRLQKQTGGYPFVAICHLHRSKLDINADFIEDYGFGHIITIGGQTHSANLLEIGMGIPTDAMNGDDANLLIDSVVGNSTLRNLFAAENFTDLVRGHRSLGGLFANFSSSPSPDHPHPREWNEDWLIRCHGSSGEAEAVCPFTGGQGKIGAIQLDIPIEVRTDEAEEGQEAFAVAVTDAVVEWISIWYRTPLRRNNDGVQESSFWKSPIFVIVLVSVLIAAVVIAVLVLVIRNRSRAVPFTQLTEDNAAEIAPSGAL